MFKIGDFVQLKSGGPCMKVIMINESKQVVWAQWVAEGKAEHGEFSFDVLQVMDKCP